jgi:hypothetical protein
VSYARFLNIQLARNELTKLPARRLPKHTTCTSDSTEADDLPRVEWVEFQWFWLLIPPIYRVRKEEAYLLHPFL